MLLFSCGSVVLLMKDMQHPDMLSVHSGSRESLWSGGSGILAVGNFFSHSVVAVQKRLQRFWLTWKVKSISCWEVDGALFGTVFNQKGHTCNQNNKIT